uniref:VE30 n=2 Tax=Enterococcus faecalis TaxID=1351 RepID=Q93A52_ENTFL|nr:VE30 [Enterococcus faecalis]
MDVNEILCVLLITVFFIRIRIYFISKKNEKILLKMGGREYYRDLTNCLLLMHSLYYLFSIVEGCLRDIQLDTICFFGILTTTTSYLISLKVMNELGKYWTIRLIFADSSIITTYWLFKYTKYKNYYFNMIPELFGITLIFRSWLTMILFICPYSICLYMRKEKENFLINNLRE